MASEKVDHDELSGKSRFHLNIIIGWLSYLLIFVTGFFLPRIIDSNLGQFSLGIWDFAWSVVHYMSFTRMDVGSSLNRFVARYRTENDIDSLKTAISTVAAFQFCVSIVVVFLSALFAYFLIFWGEQFEGQIDTVRWIVFILGSSLAVQFLFDTSRGVLTGYHRWDLFNGLYSLINLISVGLMIGTILVGGGLIEISIVYFLVTLLHGVIRTYLARRVCPEARFKMSQVSFKFAKKIIRFGLKSFFIHLAGIIVIQTIYILVASKLGPGALAILARPVALVRHIDTFITRFTFILVPMVGSMQAMADFTKLRAFTINVARYGLAFTMPVITLYCYYGPDIIRLWMGDDYVNVTLILIIGLGHFLPISQSPILQVMIGLDAHGRAAKVSLALSVAILFIGIVGINQYGWSVELAALLMVLCLTAVQGIYVPFSACKRMEINGWHYIKEVFGTVLPLGLLAFGVLAISDSVLMFGGLNFLICLPVYGLVLLFLYWQFLLNADMKVRVLEKARGWLPSGLNLKS